MRTFQKKATGSPSAVPKRVASKIVRTTIFAPAKLVTDGGDIHSRCLNCGSKPCMNFSPTEIIVPAQPHSVMVCPADAIQYSEAERTVVFSDSCVRCGLCALRCPYGAIFLGTDGIPQALPFDLALFQDADTSQTAAILEAQRLLKIEVGELKLLTTLIFDSQATTDKRTFYPLIGSVLTAIGLYTVVSRAGDTNNRMDAVILHPAHSIPIEIKSPTEVDYINVKAVRQAAENKVVMMARNMFPSEPDVTTLAVGYSYPNPRSDVDELVDDVFGTFGIRVGLLGLQTLLILLWRKYLLSEDALPIDKIVYLKGRASEAV